MREGARGKNVEVAEGRMKSRYGSIWIRIGAVAHALAFLVAALVLKGFPSVWFAGFIPLVFMFIALRQRRYGMAGLLAVTTIWFSIILFVANAFSFICIFSCDYNVWNILILIAQGFGALFFVVAGLSWSRGKLAKRG